MMNDRFAVQLRRHLVEVADERPADAQLAAVIKATAVTRQRPAWVARLRWLVDPAAPFANARTRYLVAAVALLLVAALVVVVGGGVLGGRTPFEGSWTSIDIVDRSTQLLVIAAGEEPSVHFEDDFSINCQRRGEAMTAYVADGTGELFGSRLIVQFPGGGCVTQVPPFEWFYDYDEATDTLLDHAGITWTRLP